MLGCYQTVEPPDTRLEMDTWNTAAKSSICSCKEMQCSNGGERKESALYPERQIHRVDINQSRCMQGAETPAQVMTAGR